MSAATNDRTPGLLYDGVFSGAVGATVIAFLFLVSDAFRGEALHTPTMLASMVFAGVPPSESVMVSAQMVLMSTAALLGSFLIVGTVSSAFARALPDRWRQPHVLTISVFLGLQLVFLGMDATVAQGAVDAIGLVRISVIHAFTALGMSVVLLGALRARRLTAEAPHRDPANA